MNWSELNDTAFATARGTYQHDLLRGAEKWSGAGLAGKARNYAGRYAASRKGLLERLNAAFPPGVRVDTALVFNAGSRRLERRLIVVVDGQSYDWLTESALDSEDGRLILSIFAQPAER